MDDVKFEECKTDNDGNNLNIGNIGSPMVYTNSFYRANGEPLSSFCIFENCRSKL